jgi:hypothetical protein
VHALITVLWLVFAFAACFVAFILGVGVFALLASGISAKELLRPKGGEV